MPDGLTPKETLDGARQQFTEQIDFFRKKLNLPSETWRDIQRGAHDRAFMVAGAMKADLLHDLRGAVDNAVQGGSIGEFRKQFKAIVQKNGWTGWTGEGTKAGEAWRTRVIYQTNLATSYAAGRRKQLLDPALLSRRPFWRYVHDDSVTTPRPHHKAWGDAGLTLRHDHPFWSTHFPPNGWGCKCRVVAVKAPADGDATEPPEGWLAADPKTGAPAGIDEGWDYAPGARADDDLRSFVQDKLIDYPPAISKALSADVNRHINAQDLVQDFVRDVLADRQRREPLWLGFVEQPGKLGAVAGTPVEGFTVMLPAEAPRHVDGSHKFDGAGQRPAKPADFALLLQALNDADALRAGKPSRHGSPTVVATKTINGEVFRAVWEVLSGKRNRSLQLESLVIKTKAQK